MLLWLELVVVLKGEDAGAGGREGLCDGMYTNACLYAGTARLPCTWHPLEVMSLASRLLLGEKQTCCIATSEWFALLIVVLLRARVGVAPRLHSHLPSLPSSIEIPNMVPPAHRYLVLPCKATLKLRAC